ncbi:hypothetical protein [Umezawaea sp. Da 62-37]|uniref:hypothetical protein n=1 Tax=Umezawaea sp. Da 62-37 TaxID=3075927 RepID=UPI0028F74F36|nr:hypothetical protein [Umezawaea sp. Da 62-37]WNV90042.1 hypothetical protein RM788_17610 [Umezawaea sp. Da 62-37]
MGAKEQEVVPLHAGFDVVYRGFHRRQVIEHIDNLDDQLRYTSLDRAEAMSQAADLRKLLEMTRQDLEDARSRVERLEMSPSTTAGATERLHRMLLLAEDESAELRIRADREVTSLRQRTEVELAEQREQAEREIAQLRAEVEREVARTRAEVEEQGGLAREAAARRTAQLDQREVELEHRAAEMEAEHSRRLAEAKAECAAAMEQAQFDADLLLEETAEQCNRLEAESEERRVAAQESFDQDLARRRTETDQRIAEQEALAKSKSEFVVKVASREAQRRIGEIRQHSAELVELRRTVATQLIAARSALEAAADRVPGLIPEQVSSSENGAIALRA